MVVNAGTLQLGAAGTLAASSSVNLAGATTVLNIAPSNQTLQNLSGVSGSTITMGSNILNIGGVNNTSYAGTFNGTGALVKEGSGVLSLTGASTLFTGVTTVNKNLSG